MRESGDNPVVVLGALPRPGTCPSSSLPAPAVSWPVWSLALRALGRIHRCQTLFRTLPKEMCQLPCSEPCTGQQEGLGTHGTALPRRELCGEVLAQPQVPPQPHFIQRG